MKKGVVYISGVLCGVKQIVLIHVLCTSN
jgi:hypothetical protein